MSIFWLIVLGIPALNIVWWMWAHRRLGGLRAAPLARMLLALFMVLQLALYAALFVSRWTDSAIVLPSALLSIVYLWNLLIIPLASLLLAWHEVLDAGRWAARRLFKRPDDPVALSASLETAAPTATSGDSSPQDDDDPNLSRREVLTAASVAIPPLALGGSHAVASWQLGDFRVRNVDLPFANLPPALDGLRIAHVTDIHVGKFTRGKILRDIADATNALRADMVCVTGDLIDFSLQDLPAAIDLLRALRSRMGTFICEGNHDLFEDRAVFERNVRDAGLNMMINESQTVDIRGTPLVLHGLRWGAPGQRNRAAMVDEQVAILDPQRPENGFSIMLAHHPHAFDPASSRGVDLTLAGHTHGGQLMITPSMGVATFMYKYVSGLYTSGDRKLLVSNGVGNWFPLRVNAPAEILHITLRRAPQNA